MTYSSPSIRFIVVELSLGSGGKTDATGPRYTVLYPNILEIRNATLGLRQSFLQVFHAMSPTHNVATLFPSRLTGTVVQWGIDSRASLGALVEVERFQVNEVNVPASRTRLSSGNLRPETR